MKISCCWMYAIGLYGYPPSISDMLRAIGEMGGLGFDYIELEGFGYENLGQVIANAPAIEAGCRNAGVEVSNFAALLPETISLDGGLREKAFDFFKRGVEVAARLGSPNVWIDSYAPPLQMVEGELLTTELAFGRQIRVRVPDGFSWPRFWANFVTTIARCLEIVKAHKMNLLVEPRVGEVTTNSEALIRLGEAVNDDHFGIIFDTGHQHAQKELLPLSVHKLGQLLRYIHIADNDGRDNYHYEIGNGNIDWDALFASLKQVGYDGFFAVDLEKMPDLAGKFVQTKQILQQYGARYSL